MDLTTGTGSKYKAYEKMKMSLTQNGQILPEKQSILEAMEHLLARYLEILPLFLAPALPMKVEWNINPYFGVFPLVFKALK